MINSRSKNINENSSSLKSEENKNIQPGPETHKRLVCDVVFLAPSPPTRDVEGI